MFIEVVKFYEFVSLLCKKTLLFPYCFEIIYNQTFSNITLTSQ